MLGNALLFGLSFECYMGSSSVQARLGSALGPAQDFFILCFAAPKGSKTVARGVKDPT